MKNKRIVWMLTAGLTFGMLTGCGGEEKKTYDQACADLAQGSYDYALQGYQSSITAGYKTAEAYRGAGIANIHLGNYQDAIDSLTNGLNDEKAGKALKKDMLAYRATAELKSGLNDAAMADCQTLAESYSMDAETYYLTGCVALAMDSYDEASSNFTEAYGEDATYDRAIQIYEAYLEKDMEADGTRYLEACVENRTEKCRGLLQQRKSLLLYGRLFQCTEGTYGGCESEEYRRNASSGNGLPRTGRYFQCQKYVSAVCVSGWQ